tara:strand:+ start:375 stop:785 length:411 start_codon:yes stop_codon:yes gene_type:complete
VASQQQWKLRLVVLEVISLLTLIASLFVLRGSAAENGAPTLLWLLLPAGASLTMFLSFLGLMYLRWVASAGSGNRKRVHTILFGLMTITLLSIWALAMVQTWQSMNTQDDPVAGETKQPVSSPPRVHESSRHELLT